MNYFSGNPKKPLSLVYLSVTLFLLLAVIPLNTCSRQNSNSKKEIYSDTITVMSYNVEKLFDLVDNGNEYPDYKPNKCGWNHETHARKLDNISSVIAATDADILVLVEIENLNAAKQLQKALKRKKRSYPYITTGEKPNPATTCQVILSRFPVTFSKGYGIPKSGDYYTRNILEADIAVGPETLKIFALHWPSKRYHESFRIAAANVLIDRLKKLSPETEYIIAGDFNSNYNEAETFFTGRLDDTKGRVAINHMLKTVESLPCSFINYLTERELIESQERLCHYDPWLELPEYKRFNYIYRGQYNTLDHILIPRALYDNAGISYVDNSFYVFTWDGRLIFNGIPYRWKTIYGRNGKYHTGQGYSDHLPILAKFVLKPFTFADSSIQNNYTTDSSYFYNRISGFETGFEGWLPYNRFFRLSRDTINSAAGRHSLKIEGLSKKSIGAAYIRFPLNKYTASVKKLPSVLTFNLRGSGRFAFRLRTGDNKWTCFTGDNFKRQLKSTRYITYSSRDWQEITLSLPELSNNDSVVELEIRAAGNEALCIWIDELIVK
jgi:endonuclease/exonuclease/phosphatase family metal-dependent hydrolase